MLTDYISLTADAAVPSTDPDPGRAPALLLFLLPVAVAVVTIIIAYIVNKRHKNAAAEPEAEERIENMRQSNGAKGK